MDGHIGRDVFSALLHLDECVSVDANSINVIRASRPDLARSLSYVPNYVGSEFFVEPKRDPGRVRLLYPRRLYGPRGYWLLAGIVPELIGSYLNLDIVFLGDSDEKERNHAASLKRRYPGRVDHAVALPDAMPNHYAEADISVIPTANSEGTSLSALEALAAGNAVIASDVGGLGNIIIDEHNGLLISPAADALHKAICRLIDDAALRERLQREGRNSARAFSKEKWSRFWRSTLEQKLQGKRPAAPAAPVRILHPRTDGIAWIDKELKALPRQRPHHLIKALAMLGLNVSFVEDREQKVPAGGMRGTT